MRIKPSHGPSKDSLPLLALYWDKLTLDEHQRCTQSSRPHSAGDVAAIWLKATEYGIWEPSEVGSITVKLPP